MMTVSNSDSRVLMVLGAHRSGTSAVAGVIQRLGVELGDHLFGPEAGVNDRGFWEHSDLVALHDRLLETLGSRWDSVHPLPEAWWQSPAVEAIAGQIAHIVEQEFGNSPLWGFKDPRLCRLLPLWLDILARAGRKPSFILVYRHPLEVADSLAQRDQMGSAQALNLWLQHMLDAEFYSRNHPRAIISYADLLDDWRKTMNTVSTRLSLEWPFATDRAASEIDAFLERSLRHHRYGGEDLPGLPGLSLWIKDIYLGLKHASALDHAAFTSQFDSIRSAHQAALCLFSPLLRSEQERLKEAESGFRKACEIIEDQKTHTELQDTLMHDVGRGFTQAIDMLNAKDAELAKCQALLAERTGN